MGAIYTSDGAILWRGDGSPMVAAARLARERPWLVFLDCVLEFVVGDKTREFDVDGDIASSIRVAADAGDWLAEAVGKLICRGIRVSASNGSDDALYLHHGRDAAAKTRLDEATRNVDAVVRIALCEDAQRARLQRVDTSSLLGTEHRLRCIYCMRMSPSFHRGDIENIARIGSTFSAAHIGCGARWIATERVAARAR